MSFVSIEMSRNKESSTRLKPNQPDVMPETSQPPSRSHSLFLADELSSAAELIKWPRMPELREFEQMADLIIAPGYYGMGELMDTSTSERDQPTRLWRMADRAGRA